MRLPVLTALAIALTTAGCDAPAGRDNAATATPQMLSVTDTIVQLPAVPGRPGAAYFTLRAGAEPVRLTSVSSDRVERIELHQTRMEGDVMRMEPLADGSVPANGSLVFEQGGRHAMLFGIAPALKAGETLALTFTFESGETIDTQAQVRAFGGGDEGH